MSILVTDLQNLVFQANQNIKKSANMLRDINLSYLVIISKKGFIWVGLVNTIIKVSVNL